MKKTLYPVLFLIALLVSCSKNEDNVITYGNDDLYLKIRNSSWYTTLDSSGEYWFGYINLKFTGYTNANQLFLSSYGSGKDSQFAVDLNEKKEFSGDLRVGIFFSYRKSLKGWECSSIMTLYAIKDNHTLKVDLESGKMKF